MLLRPVGGANHGEEVPHLVKPGWQHLMTASDLPEGKPVRQLLGEVPVVAVRINGAVHVLSDRCSHMSGPLSDSELVDGCLTCPWHGSVFRVADGSVARGPATAPQPAFQAARSAVRSRSACPARANRVGAAPTLGRRAPALRRSGRVALALILGR
jgi:nitrite reductase/ring-hydroxylating ferredoxin subunit